MKRKYYLLLPYNEKFYISDEEKREAEAELAKNREEQGYLRLGTTTIDARQIKGIFSAIDERQETQDLEWIKYEQEEIRQFNEDCLSWSKKTPEAKAKREMRVRIVPCWTLMGNKREDKAMVTLYYWIRWWFKQNPQWPRCPAWFWWRWFEQTGLLKGKPTRFNHYIAVNDVAIYHWVKEN